MRTLGLWLLLAAATARAEPSFDEHWHDGKAELDGYLLTVQRYGHPRRGRAVMIYVTEPLSAQKHVKVEDAQKNPADTIDVLKLNLLRSFQTGLYDYATMESLFVRTDTLVPLKSAFSSTEWCGQVYEELDVRDAQLSARIASYFEGESSAAQLAIPAGGLLEDDLFIALRGLRGAFLRPGERRSIPLLGSAFYRRLAHKPLGWAPATIERLAQSETVQVPAGSYKVSVYLVRPVDGRVGRFEIEDAHPHRVVRWTWTAPPGAPALGGVDAGELTGSARLPYWNLHDPGDEKQLRLLGLPPPPSAAP
jgi:hypothetical protein